MNAGAAPSGHEPITPAPAACGQLEARPVSLPGSDIFSVADRLVVIGSGSQPDYRPRVSVMEPHSMTWKDLDPRGGPALVEGYSNYSISWFPVGDRLVGMYPLGFVVVDPKTLRWHRAEIPKGLLGGSKVVTEYEIVLPTHRFDAERVRFQPSPPALGEHGPYWVAFGRTVVAMNPSARSGVSVSLVDGKATPLSFEGVPAFTGSLLVSRLGTRKVLVVGATGGTDVEGAVYDVKERTWRVVHADGLHAYAVPDAPGAWLDKPGGPQQPGVLYLLDPDTLAFSRHPLPTGVNTLPGPHGGVYVFDATSLRLFLPGRGEVCAWSTEAIPKNQMAGTSWQHPGFHKPRILDAEGGLNPFQTAMAVGRRILVTSDQSRDDNPPCPPGAPCLPHNERLVRHQSYAGLIEFR